jgi:hypothetical protein
MDEQSVLGRIGRREREEGNGEGFPSKTRLD